MLILYWKLHSFKNFPDKSHTCQNSKNQLYWVDFKQLLKLMYTNFTQYGLTLRIADIGLLLGVLKSLLEQQKHARLVPGLL